VQFPNVTAGDIYTGRSKMHMITVHHQVHRYFFDPPVF